MSAKVNLDVSGVLQRISDAVGAKNDHQLAAATGTAQTTISTWRAKNRVPYDLCVNVSQSHNVHIAWLLFGEDAVAPRSSLTDEFGMIDINFFDFCWAAATRVNEAEPDIATKLAAVTIYNSMWPKLISLKSGDSTLTRSQAAMYYTVFDQLGMFDWSSFAKALKVQLVEYPNVAVDAMDYRQPKRRPK